MKLHLDQFIGFDPAPDIVVTPLDPRRQERILQMTMKKINKNCRKASSHRRRPLTVAAVIAAVLVLLCGSAFAVHEFEWFDFSTLFGDNAEVIEDAIVTFEPTPSEVISAHTGRNESNYARIEDYNIQLRGTIDVTDTLIYADFQVSTVSEDIPPFSTTGMKILIDGYETENIVRFSGDVEYINVYAKVTEKVPSNTPINIQIETGETRSELLSNAPAKWLDANTIVISEPDQDSDIAVDTVSMTNATITVKGHFQKEFEDYSDALDASGYYVASGNFRWPLYDKDMTEFDPAEQQEDLEGYLTLREVNEDGTFVLEWATIKQFMGYGTLVFYGQEYEVTAPETEVQTTDFVPNFASSAETQDYRFTLESIVATTNAIYAIMDMEPITEYGKTHMDLSSDELYMVCSNMTNIASGTSGSALLETDGNVSRYLIYALAGKDASFSVGYIISFQILSIVEDGDTAEHSYGLFETELTSVLTETLEAIPIDECSPYDSLTITPLSIHLSPMSHKHPSVDITFTDGTEVHLLDDTWQPTKELEGLGEYGIAASTITGSSGNTYLFSQIIPLEEIKAVYVDGIEYSIK